MDEIIQKLITAAVTAIGAAIYRAYEKRKLKKKGLLFDSPPNMNGADEKK